MPSSGIITVWLLQQQKFEGTFRYHHQGEKLSKLGTKLAVTSA
jgi:hypothetical protein